MALTFFKIEARGGGQDITRVVGVLDSESSGLGSSLGWSTVLCSKASLFTDFTLTVALYTH